MPRVNASIDQFRRSGDKVYHTPTGAWWSAYVGQAHPTSMHTGLLGEVLDDGDEYNEEEVQRFALCMLRERG